MDIYAGHKLTPRIAWKLRKGNGSVRHCHAYVSLSEAYPPGRLALASLDTMQVLVGEV